MSKKKHILDWYIENTPSNEKEYDKGVLIVAAILFAIFYGFVIAVLLIESNQNNTKRSNERRTDNTANY